MERWTRHVDVFEGKYLVIPPVLGSHWALFVLANHAGTLVIVVYCFAKSAPYVLKHFFVCA